MVKRDPKSVALLCKLESQLRALQASTDLLAMSIADPDTIGAATVMKVLGSGLKAVQELSEQVKNEIRD